MEYYAHISEDGTRRESVRQHLDEVAEMAAGFAEPFGAKEEAYRAGKCHDAGKYGERFQRRIRGEKIEADHSTAGAQLLAQQRDLWGAMAVAGHHGGLPDLGSRMDTAQDNTLTGRCKRKVDDYRSFFTENEIPVAKVPNYAQKGNGFERAFFTRMLFSGLVDADYLCTERFMENGQVERGGSADVKELRRRFDVYSEKKWSAEDTPLNVERAKIRRRCIEMADAASGLFKLTIPTGGGKTAASMAFALNHAVRHGKQRVIYVIPYTSIIEQNSDVFASALGEENVLQHHSASDMSIDENDPAVLRKRLAAENWDAPIIMTTAVQFLESLFAAKTSKCRKLHNIANSIVIFDEAQMLPLNLLRPCVAAISELVKNYGVTAVLCTATQPALDTLFQEFLPHTKPVELAPPDLNHSVFQRVHYVYTPQTEQSAILEELNAQQQVLCIVNTRARAERWYSSLKGDGNYHLSTRMTPNHRRRILQEVRKRLEKGLTCRLISTSLVEAGVDVDFPVVYREIAGIDSIVQAAGRCNRNGKTHVPGTVHIFNTGEKAPLLQERNISAGESILNRGMMPDDPKAVERYFREIYHMTGMEQMDRGCDGRPVLRALIEGDCGCQIPIRTVSKRFKVIHEDTCTVCIPTADNVADIDSLRSGIRSRALMRRLGQDSVSLYRTQYQLLKQAGKLEAVEADLAILVLPEQNYDENTGIRVSATGGDAIFC